MIRDHDTHLREAIEAAYEAARQALRLLQDEPAEDAAPVVVTSAKRAPASAALLSVDEVAERLKVDRRWVYRNAPRWGFTRKLGRRTLRFEPRGFEKFLASRVRL